MTMISKDKENLAQKQTMKNAGNRKSLGSIYKKWKKLFFKEEMEQCLFHVYCCVQPLGQDSIWKHKKTERQVPCPLVGKTLACSVYFLCSFTA